MTNADPPGEADPADERSRAVLLETGRILNFWRTFGPDRRGGFNVKLTAGGSPYEESMRCVVSAARFTVNFATAAVAFNSDEYRGAAQEAFEYTQTFHDGVHGGYFWSLKDGVPHDTRKLAYGHAFAFLAAAAATKAALPGAAARLTEIGALLQQRFFVGDELSWDVADADWENISPIRSNNPNMHFCEAFIAAYEATGDRAYLNTALNIATVIARPTLAGGGPVLENYDQEWTGLPVPPAGVDSALMQSPWAALPGHLAEWAKLLGILHQHTGQDWLLEAAVAQYELAWRFGWDYENGGFVLGVDADGTVSMPMKSYWSPPEAIGAAAVLERATGKSSYREDREVLWAYVERTMIDPDQGGWFKTPSLSMDRTDFRKGDDFDPDYHALGGCFEELAVLHRVVDVSPSTPSRTQRGTR